MRYLLPFILLLSYLSSNAQLVDSTSFSKIQTAFALKKGSDKNIWNKPIIGIREGEAWGNINPWFDLSLDQSNGKNYLRNSRGFIISGKAGNFRFLSALQETQLDAKSHEFNQAIASVSLRGSNRFKYRDKVHDFADYMAGVYYSNNKFWASFASAPLKIGDGIRSQMMDNHNTGFTHATAGIQFFDNSLEINYGIGTLINNFRLKAQSNSETPLSRNQISL